MFKSHGLCKVAACGGWVKDCAAAAFVRSCGGSGLRSEVQGKARHHDAPMRKRALAGIASLSKSSISSGSFGRWHGHGSFPR